MVGVTYEETKTGRVHELRGSAVVLSAGGFGADRRPGGLLEKYLSSFLFTLFFFNLSSFPTFSLQASKHQEEVSKL